MDVMHPTQTKMTRCLGERLQPIGQPRLTAGRRYRWRCPAAGHLQSLTSWNVIPVHGMDVDENRQLYRLKGVSFGGSGIFFWWEIGTIQSGLDAQGWTTSGGALAATLCACKVDPFVAFDVANRLSEENNIFERPWGLAGIWGKLIRQWMDELLPENAAEVCRDRVSIIVTTLPSLKLQAISDFDSKEGLIDANMASAHIPFFLDGKLSSKFNELDCIDGSLHDFFSGCGSDILTCNGSTLNIDYFDDERLDRKRFDFIALKKPTEVINMIYLGYQYAEQLSKTEEFQKVLIRNPRDASMPDLSSSIL